MVDIWRNLNGNYIAKKIQPQTKKKYKEANMGIPIPEGCNAG